MHTCAQCSHASVGVAQAHLNYIGNATVDERYEQHSYNNPALQYHNYSTQGLTYICYHVIKLRMANVNGFCIG